MNIYAIYKGEKFLFEGTTKECANFLKVKENTIYFLNNICYKKRIETKRKNGKSRNCLEAVCLERRKSK